MITIIDSPASGQTVQDSLWHTIISDASGTTDFKYIFDVWVNGTQKIRVKQYPDTDGQGYFDAGPTVRNTMTYAWFVPTNAIVQSSQPDASGGISQTYQIRYGEEVSGVSTLNMASGSTTAYNYLPSLLRRKLDTIAAKAGKWFTNRPLVADAGLTDNLFIPLSTTGAPTLTIKKYNQSNVLVDTETYVSPKSNFIQCNVGPVAINNEFSGFIDDSVRFYTVDFGGDLFKVNLNCENIHTVFNLHFLNAWGMFDTARFSKVSRLTMDVQRKGYARKDYSTSSGIPSYISNNVFNETKINHAVMTDHSYKLTMDSPTDAEYQWLAELVSSSQVLLEVDGYYYYVTIKATNYEYSKYVNNKLRPFEIEIEINQPRKGHLR